MTAGCATPGGTAGFAARTRAPPESYITFADLTLSSVGVGTYLGDADAKTDLLVKEAVVASVKAGINVIDTAINYRAQKAERSVGAAVSELVSGGVPREGLFICTKNGYVTNDADTGEEFWQYVQRNLVAGGAVKAGDISSQYHCMTVPYLEDQLERSLSNLDLECIDLLYLHNAAEGQLQDRSREEFLKGLRDVFEMYERKRGEGVIRYYGMATWECFRTAPESAVHLQMEDVLRIACDVGGRDHGLRFIQLPYNAYLDQALILKNQRCRGELTTALEAARALGIGVFASVPLMQGRLLAPGVMPEFGSMPPALRALQLVRSTPGILAPLVGHKSREHVLENLRIMEIPPLTDDKFHELVKKLIGKQPGLAGSDR